MGNIEMKKEKKGNLSCRKHFKGADFSFRSGMMRVQIPRGTPLGLRTAMREGKKRGAGTQFFFLLASMHPHTHTQNMPGLFYGSPPVQCTCRGASVYPKPHSQISTSNSNLPFHCLPLQQQQVEVPRLTLRSSRLPLGKVHKPLQAV